MLPYSKDRISPEKPLPFNSSSYPVHERDNQKFNLDETRNPLRRLYICYLIFYILSTVAPKNPKIIYVHVFVYKHYC